MTEPYYEDEHVTVFNADCRDVITQIPLNTFDLCLTDFPYGNDTEYDIYEDSRENLVGLIEDVMPQILMVAKRALITCGNKNMHLYPPPNWTLAWVVPSGVGSGPWGFSCWQPILAYGKDPYLENNKGRRPDIIEKIEVSNVEGHPCAKPYDFWMTLLLRGSVKQTDVIFDPFMGSGVTLQVARATGRSAVGIELSEKYCELAVKEYLKTPPLFAYG